MNGFITESTSKISDGFGTTLFLLALYSATNITYPPVVSSFGRPGVFAYILILLGIGIFMLQRSIAGHGQEEKHSGSGLTAGLLLWQVTRFSNLLGNIGLFNQTGYLVWLMVFLMTLVLWKKLLPLGIKYFTLTFLCHWLGILLVNSQTLIESASPVVQASWLAFRVLGAVGIFVFIGWIVFKAFTPTQRKFCGLGLYFCILLTGLWF
jgi:hypothetical protein